MSGALQMFAVEKSTAENRIAFILADGSGPPQRPFQWLATAQIGISELHTAAIFGETVLILTSLLRGRNSGSLGSRHVRSLARGP